MGLKQNLNRRRAKIVVLVVLVSAAVALWYLWTNFVDTRSRRIRVNEEVRQLVAQAKKDPNDKTVALELLRRARGNYSFGATSATVGLGKIGDAAVPVIQELADLMNSDDPYVRREAANSLSKLGPRSVVVMDKLAAQIAKEPSDDESWFAADAIGKIGKPATKYLPLLRSRLGTGEVQFNDSLKQAIKELEAIENQAVADGNSN